MPDFTIENAAICASNTEWSYPVPGGKYTVTYGQNYGPDASEQYGFHCTCPAFKFGRGKECKHIASAKPLHCGWNSVCDTGPAPEDGCCPKCKGPLEFIRVAV